MTARGHTAAVPTRVFIYALVDPRTQRIRYVGQTRNPGQRYDQHLSRAKNPALSAWARELHAQGLHPLLRVLTECADRRKADDQERFTIRSLRNQGADLFNVADGRGPGTAATRAPAADLLALAAELRELRRRAQALEGRLAGVLGPVHGLQGPAARVTDDLERLRVAFLGLARRWRPELEGGVEEALFGERLQEGIAA